VIGGPTPGGSDRYIRDTSSHEVYVMKGDLFRDLDSPETHLLERELHAWKETDVRKAHITAGSKSRDLVRGGGEGKRFWADPATSEQNDETAGNWMSKVDRLHPTEYVVSAPAEKVTVARIEYTGGASLGWLEIAKAPGANGKSDYFVQTERTRLLGKVPPALAEQVEQDVGSIAR
jgi:hypothetical protein